MSTKSIDTSYIILNIHMYIMCAVKEDRHSTNILEYSLTVKEGRLSKTVRKTGLTLQSRKTGIP